MTVERGMALVTIMTIATQLGLFLVSGGFTVGGKLSNIDSEMRLLRQEVQAANKIQDFRLDKVEAATKQRTYTY
ncbi:MAG: hypothetical protein RLZZ86_335 [Cyanobacteriota bacterium]|jgi:hypothetical protein